LAQSALVRLYGADLIPEGLLRAGLVLTYLALLGFIGRNFRLPGIRIIAVGVILNFAVIVANGGLMPVSPETLAQVSPPEHAADVAVGNPVPYSKDVLLERHNTRLWWLSDAFTLPAFASSHSTAFSVGDVLIMIGLLYLLISAVTRVWYRAGGKKPQNASSG